MQFFTLIPNLASKTAKGHSEARYRSKKIKNFISPIRLIMLQRIQYVHRIRSKEVDFQYRRFKGFYVVFLVFVMQFSRKRTPEYSLE